MVNRVEGWGFRTPSSRRRVGGRTRARGGGGPAHAGCVDGCIAKHPLLAREPTVWTKVPLGNGDSQCFRGARRGRVAKQLMVQGNPPRADPRSKLLSNRYQTGQGRVQNVTWGGDSNIFFVGDSLGRVLL